MGDMKCRQDTTWVTQHAERTAPPLKLLLLARLTLSRNACLVNRVSGMATSRFQ